MIDAVDSPVDAESVSSSRQCKGAIAINSCVVGHLFVFKPNPKNAFIWEHVCDCKSCLFLEFQNCLNIGGSKSNDDVEYEENTWLAGDEPK